MSASMRIFGVFSIVAAFVSAPAFAAAITTEVVDATITSQIETTFLLNEHLNPFNINTNTHKGVVTLSGGVQTEVQRDLAAELAQAVNGVVEVKNNIVVVNDIPPVKDRRNWRQVVVDKSLSASVRSRLLYHKQFAGTKIDVKTRNNIVTLAGVVSSDELKAGIEQVAMDTRGVESVENQLVVQPREERVPLANAGQRVTDQWVEKRVETALLINRHMDVRNLNVTVRDGICVLAGTVGTEDQQRLAAGIAESISGVVEVRNELSVAPGAISEPDDLPPIEPIEPQETAPVTDSAPVAPASTDAPVHAEDLAPPAE